MTIPDNLKPIVEKQGKKLIGSALKAVKAGIGVDKHRSGYSFNVKVNSPYTPTDEEIEANKDNFYTCLDLTKQIKKFDPDFDARGRSPEELENILKDLKLHKCQEIYSK